MIDDLPSLRVAHEAMSWRDDANCRGLDPALFFPDHGSNATEAKYVCAGCTVRAECLDWAIRSGEKGGVWGGLTERERKPLRRRRWLVA